MTRPPHETIKCLDGYTIEVHRDEHPLNARHDYDNLGTFWGWEKRCDCGDNGDKAPRLHPSDFSGWEELDAAVAARPGVRIVLPVYKYEHSGVAYSTTPFGCPWDSGRVGVIFAENEEIAGMTDEQIRACLVAEVSEYSAWANGEVYGYIARSPEGEDIGSCWGFIGDAIKAGIEEAKSEIEHHRSSVATGEQLVINHFAL